MPTVTEQIKVTVTGANPNIIHILTCGCNYWIWWSSKYYINRVNPGLTQLRHLCISRIYIKSGRSSMATTTEQWR